MSKDTHKSHNIWLIMYHFVCPAKYKRIVFSEDIEKTLKKVCLEISNRYDVVFLEIGTDKNHVHFLVQTVPTLSPTKIISTIKSITSKKIFEKHPEVKEKFWGGEFWSDTYSVSTVGMGENEEVVANYVKNQGKDNKYKKLHQQKPENEEISFL